eukprot:CAMPEP_0194064256 /NCGR_PEP_ID=MMETSP0009_2-20130614/82519_1 /TAXON_ID=210454 /ORGANISM="Grammatophora oceanica, Strain CCMP 410" /LENGTH=41 /DNA_ID= /DNA_START= /DNA_END= /DNA_ORIENTATION=
MVVEGKNSAMGGASMTSVEEEGPPCSLAKLSQESTLSKSVG